MAVSAAIAVFALLWFAPGAWSVPPEKTDSDAAGAPYVAGELIVAYDPGFSGRALSGLPRGVEARVEKELSQVDSRLISFPEVKAGLSEAAREQALERIRRGLESSPGVTSAGYNYLRTAFETPNDPLFSQQYGLTKIKAPKAWNTARGQGVRIAVVDTGIDAGHPDLSKKIVAQRDEVNEDRVAEDDAGHGTSVAGVAAAVTNNERGVAGTCPKCSLMVSKVGNSTTKITVANEVEGINWAVDNGADVINISLGGPGYVESEKRAVDRAWNNGVVVVAAAGNEDTNEPSYPAAYERAISVAATDRNDRRADFSNFGSTIDLAAPGVDILSTDVRGPSGFTTGAYVGGLAGTSFSAPFVSGVAGLLASQGRSAAGIRNRLERTADDLGAGDKDRYYGNGRVNAARAVGNVQQPPEEPENSAPKVLNVRPAPDSAVDDRTPLIGATVRDAETNLSKDDIRLLVDGRERKGFSYNRTRDRLTFEPEQRLATGTHSVKVVARDAQGLTTNRTWSFKVKPSNSSGGPGGGDDPSAWLRSDDFPFDILPDEYPFGVVKD
jgi:thermitase